MFQAAGICIWYFNIHLHSYIRCMPVYACPSYAWLYTDRDSVSSALMTKCRDRSSTLPAKDTVLFLTYFQNWKDSKKAMALHVKGFSHVFTCKNSCTYIRNMTIMIYESNWMNLSKWDDLFTLNVQIPYLFLHFVAFFLTPKPFLDPNVCFLSQANSNGKIQLSTTKQHPPR